MLRTTSNSLYKTIPAWRNSVIYSSVKSYTTPATSTPANEKKQQEEKKPSLSARLGGSGRGKAMSAPNSAAADPFASFLANAKKPRGPNNNNNDRRNGNFTPRPRRQQQDNKGQFADAEGSESTTNNNKPRQSRGNNNNKSKTQRKTSATVESVTTTNENATLTEGGNNNNNKRQPRSNKNNNNRNNNNADGSASAAPRKINNRRMNLNRSQPQEVRTRRATTFIDKDIDWSSLSTLAETESSIAADGQEVKEDGEQLLKDIQGDYDRYLNVGSDISWPQMINGSTVGTLVGSNATFDLSQKTAFLSALSSATGGNAAAASARK